MVSGLNATSVSDDGNIDNGNNSLKTLQLDNDTSFERLSELNDSLQVGDFNIPIIMNLNIKGLQKESRTIKVNCRPKTFNSVETSDYFGAKPLLERSICEFSVQEAMVMVGFLFLLLMFILSGLFLCCSSGREDTVPVAIVSKTSNNQTSPKTSQVYRGSLPGDDQSYY